MILPYELGGIGGWRLERLLGEGGFASVYFGRHRKLTDRVRAIKIPHDKLAIDDKRQIRFDKEASSLAAIDHENVVKLHDFIYDDQLEKWCLVMEFVDGETLSNIIRRDGATHVNIAVPIFCQVLEGVGVAHKLGIFHRDIKPSNILLSNDGIPKISDFGIAKLSQDEDNIELTKTGIGTSLYMAPEQILVKKVDARTDVYSLGVTLFQYLTGHYVYEDTAFSMGDYEIAENHIKKDPVIPSVFNPEISKQIDHVVLKSLSKEPDDRYNDALDMREALLEAIGKSEKVIPNRPYKVDMFDPKTTMGNEGLVSPKSMPASKIGIDNQKNSIDKHVVPVKKSYVTEKKKSSIISMVIVIVTILVLTAGAYMYFFISSVFEVNITSDLGPITVTMDDSGQSVGEFGKRKIGTTYVEFNREVTIPNISKGMHSFTIKYQNKIKIVDREVHKKMEPIMVKFSK